MDFETIVYLVSRGFFFFAVVLLSGISQQLTYNTNVPANLRKYPLSLAHIPPPHNLGQLSNFTFWKKK